MYGCINGNYLCVKRIFYCIFRLEDVKNYHLYKISYQLYNCGTKNLKDF